MSLITFGMHVASKNGNIPSQNGCFLYKYIISIMISMVDALRGAYIGGSREVMVRGTEPLQKQLDPLGPIASQGRSGSTHGKNHCPYCGV